MGKLVPGGEGDISILSIVNGHVAKTITWHVRHLLEDAQWRPLQSHSVDELATAQQISLVRTDCETIHTLLMTFECSDQPKTRHVILGHH